MIQPIYLYGSEVLRKKAAEADLAKKEELTALIRDLKDFRRVIINPEILEESDEKVTYSEGCLSIPNIYCDVVRPAKMTLRYYNEDFEEVTETLDKFACRMVQHELSHLDGNLFTDNVPPIRRKMIASKLQNIAKGKVHPHYNSKLK